MRTLVSLPASRFTSRWRIQIDSRPDQTQDINILPETILEGNKVRYVRGLLVILLGTKKLLVT